MKKRILSLTLVLCMLVSILPTISIISAASEVKYTYDFTTNAVAGTYDIAKLNAEVAAAKNNYTVKYTALNAFAATPTIDTAKTTGWSVANTRYVCNATTAGGTYSELTSEGFRFLLATNRYFDETSGNGYFGTNNWTAGNCTHVAFVINIPVAGTYDLNMFNNVAHTYGAHTEVRFGKATKTTLGNADVTSLYNAADTVVLGWHDSTTVHNGSASNPAETFTITASEAGNYFIIFGTPNETLAKNQKRLSTADTEVTTGAGFQTLNLSKITLSEHIVSLSVEASISNSMIEVGETAQIAANAGFTNGDAANGVAYTYVPKDSGVVSVDANGKVTGLKAGETEITVKGELGDKSDEVTLSVKVIEKLPDTVTLTYDFNQVNGETSDNLVYSAIDTAYANTNGTWSYAGINAVSIKTQSAYGANIAMTKSVPYSAIKLNIPYAGKYSAKLVHHKNKSSGGKSDIFLIPSDADVSSIAAITANKDKIPLFDDVNFRNPDGTNLIDAETEPCNIRVLEAGEYYLVFHSTGTDGTTYGAFPHKLILEGVNKTDRAVMYFEPTTSSIEVEEQQSTDITLSGWMTDGSEIPDDVGFTYTSMDAGIVSVDNNGTVTGVKKGETEIIIKSVCDELTTERAVSVTVTEKLPDTVTLTYDFNQVNGETSNNLVYSAIDTAYANTNGTWSYAGINAVSIKTQSAYGANIGMTKSVPYSAIKLNIPYAGSYSAKLIHHKNKSSGGKVDIFLVPASADVSSIAAITANEDKIPLFEELNFNNAAANLIDVETEPRSIRVSEGGEYYLVFHSTGTDSTTYGAFPHKLILEGVNKTDSAVMYFDASVSKKEIKKNETAKILFSGWMTDGSAISNDVAASYTPADANIISIDESGTVTGLSDGRTDIDITLSHTGLKLSKKVKIIVDSAEKTGYKIIYNLGDTAGKNVNTKPEFATHTYETSNGFWKYLSNSANQAGADWAFGYVGTGFRVAQNRWMAFEIEVPVAGTYSMYIEHGENKSGCDVGVYVSPAEATDSVISDNYKIGSYNCDNDAVETNFTTYKAEPSYVSNVTFPTAGKYRIAFRTPKGSDYSVVGNIILEGGDGLLLMKADMDISEGGKVELSGIMSDGSVADFSNATVKLSSSDSDVAEAPESGYALKLNTLGTTIITAEIEYGVSKLTISKEYTVTKLPMPFSGADTEYIFYQKSGDWDSAKNPVPGFEVSDRIEDIRGITYKYTGTDGEGNWQYNSTGPSWIPGKYQVFMYAGNGTAATHYLRIQNPKDGDWIALDIKVPAAGRYVAEYEYSVFNRSATKSDIYILPKNETTDTTEEISALLTDENLLASVDYLDASLASNEIRTAKLGDIEFSQAGEYILVHKRNDGNRGGYLSPRKLTLYGVNGMCDAEIIVDKTTLNYNETAKVTVSAMRLDGSVVLPDDYTITLTSSDSSIVSVSEDGAITAKGDGKATISVTVVDNAGKTAKADVEITAVDNTGIKETVFEVLSPVYVSQKAETSLKVIMNSGNVITVPYESVSYSFDKQGIVSIDGNGKLSGVSVGTVEITASAEYKGESVSATASVEVILDDRKSEPTYYTYEMREAILENVAKYDWAKSSAKTEAAYGDKYVEQYEFIYNILPGEGIPRTTRVALKTDPEPYVCRYCNADLDGEYSGGGLSSGFTVNVYGRPWKLQCPGCKRLFPSNDFESFYELGRDKQGYFDVERARQLHHEMLFHKDGNACSCKVPAEEFSEEWYEFYGYGNPEGYLYNELYGELYDSNGAMYNKDPRTGDEIVGVRWGVDDGFGYRPGRMVSESCEEVHTYIANYNLELHDELISAILHLTRAYLYTGDIKYGRAGAIITDRLADLYPSYDLEAIGGPNYSNNDGGRGLGKTHGAISESQNGPHITLACDAFFTALDDPQVINFLSKEAEKRGLENDKSTPEKIWDNWESGILDEFYYALQRRQVAGNFGMDQNGLACAAIVRDREPLTSEMIEWIYATNTTPNDRHKVTGGNLMSQLIDVVDRDGNNNESSPSYNGILIQNLYVVAQILSNYTGRPEYNLYNNPKYVELFVGLIPTFATENKSLAIGDAGAVANTKAFGYLNYYYDTFDKMKDTVYGPKIANYLYMRNGFTAEGLNYGIYAKDPERLEKEILERIDPDYRQESINMTGYGLAILRDGTKSKDATMQTRYNSLRDTWIYYGGAGTGHKHKDTLEIGMDAFGIDIAPDLGEPEQKTQQPNRLQWVSTTISHNTVLVNEKEQDKIAVSSTVPIHFDDSGMVKVIDVEAPGSYKETSEYRRTAVVVEADNDVSYTVDFFRIKGGTHHSYSFHSQAENAYPIEGLDFTTKWDENGNYITGAQVAKEDGEYTMSFWNDKNVFVTEPVFKKAGEYIGSYASPSLECGPDPNSPWIGTYQTVYPRGYSWMSNVRRDSELESGKFTVEFDVKDYRKVSTSSDGVKLRMTQVNDFIPSEVIITAGYVPQRADNREMPKTLDYVLVNRESSSGSLDTLYTTVFEPYKNNPYIASVDACDISTEESASDDTAKAVKVTHTSGRVDYIVFAVDNSVVYTVTDSDYSFDFRGAIGVLSCDGDGNIIYRYVNDGDIIGENTNSVSRYSGTVKGFNRELSFDNYIDVDMECDDLEALAKQYIYVQNDGERNGVFEIEGASENQDGTIRLDIGTTSLIRGHKDKNDVNGGYIYDIAENQKFVIPMPFEDNNAPVAEAVGTVSATAGSNLSLAIKATSPIDGEKLEYAGITLPKGASVDKETGVFTWKPTNSQIGNNHIAVSVKDSAGRECIVHFTVAVYGSTTGGGGGASTPSVSDKPETPDEPGTGTTPGENEGENENVRFKDLGAHAWAADSINALADEGIIKGTSENTYSPASNITRADFAILLVRAFEKTSDNTENFSDVSESDYFAKELAIARNTGLVGGIGDNKFAPKANIKRCDMMLMIYRVIGDKLNKSDAPEYADFVDVPEYAKEAVSALIGAGLVNGKNGKIAPNDNTTRAEVAVLLKRVLEFVEEK